MNFRPVDDLVLPNSLTPTLSETPTNLISPQLSVTQAAYHDEAAVAFQQLTRLGGYSAIPNCLLDRLRGVLDRNQYDVFLYIIRRTLCFHKLSDAISLSQFQSGLISRTGVRLDYGCGIRSSETIHRSIKGLREAGFIEVQATTTYNGGNGANLYSVRYESVLAALYSTPTALSEPKSLSSNETDAPVIIAGDNAAIESVVEVELVNTLHPQTNQGSFEPPTPISSVAPPLTARRIHKTKTLNQDQKQVRPWGKPMVAGTLAHSTNIVMSSKQIQADAELLTKFGFEPRQSLRLAKLADTFNKPTSYIASLINYASKHASTNPHGMVRRLVERGEERFHTRRVQATSRFTGWLDAPEQVVAVSTSVAVTTEPQSIPKITPTLPLAAPASTSEKLFTTDPSYVKQMLITYLANPVALLKRFEEGQEEEEVVREVLQRLGVYRRLESEFWQARHRYFQNKKRSA